MEKEIVELLHDPNTIGTFRTLCAQAGSEVCDIFELRLVQSSVNNYFKNTFLQSK